MLVKDMDTYQINSAQELGTLLKKRRKELHLTQKELALSCNLSHTGIGKIEMAESDIKLETFLKLSKFLGFIIQVQLKNDDSKTSKI